MAEDDEREQDVGPFVLDTSVDALSREGQVEALATWITEHRLNEITGGNPDGDGAVATAIRMLARGKATDEFCDWLLRMDDPADAEGCEMRRRVNMTEILRRAREARGEPTPAQAEDFRRAHGIERPGSYGGDEPG